MPMLPENILEMLRLKNKQKEETNVSGQADLSFLEPNAPNSSVMPSEEEKLLSSINAAKEPVAQPAPKSASIKRTIASEPQPKVEQAQPQTVPAMDAAAVKPAASIYGDELSDEAIKKAQEERKKTEGLMNLFKAGDMIGSAIGGTKETSGRFDKFVDEKAQLEKDILARRAGKEQEVKFNKLTNELEDEKKLQDPNSAISVTTREAMKQFMPGIAKQMGNNVSAMTLKNMGIDLGRLLVAKENADARRENTRLMLEMNKDRRNDLQKQRSVNNMQRYQEAFNKDKVALKALEGLNSAGDAEELLKSNTPIGDEAVKSALAKLSGEVGVLTDQDIQRFGGSKALGSRMKQLAKQAKDGRLTEENRSYMLELIRVYKQKREQQLQERALDLAKQGSKRFEIPEEEAYDILRPGKEFPQSKAQNPIQKASSQQLAANEVERLDKKTGKVAVFDATTKQFLRWK